MSDHSETSETSSRVLQLDIFLIEKELSQNVKSISSYSYRGPNMLYYLHSNNKRSCLKKKDR